jgi:hypothetical protein
MGLPPREESRMERLARLAGLEVDELRDYLRYEIAVRQEEQELAWREEQMRILMEAWAEQQLEAEPRASDAPVLRQ